MALYFPPTDAALVPRLAAADFTGVRAVLLADDRAFSLHQT